MSDRFTFPSQQPLSYTERLHLIFTCPWGRHWALPLLPLRCARSHLGQFSHSHGTVTVTLLSRCDTARGTPPAMAGLALPVLGRTHVCLRMGRGICSWGCTVWGFCLLFLSHKLLVSRSRPLCPHPLKVFPLSSHPSPCISSCAESPVFWPLCGV